MPRTGGGRLHERTACSSRHPGPEGRWHPAGDGHRLRHAVGPDRRRRRRRHHPRRRQRGHGRPGLRRHAVGHRRGHGAPHRRRGPGQAQGHGGGGHAVDELPRLPRGDRPQRRPAPAGRRLGGEARGRPEAARHDPGHPRRRDPGDGPPRAHAAVRPHARRVQGPGQGVRRRPGPARRRRGPGRGRLLLHRAGMRARRRGGDGDRGGARPHHRDRRRRPLRRPGARLPRPARAERRTGAEVRAPLRRPAGRRHGRRDAIRRRRPLGPVPFGVRDLPLRRRHPGARALPGGECVSPTTETPTA